MLSPDLMELARKNMRQHLDGIDWTKLTNGRREILEAFLRLATSLGYEGVTMRALGKAVNVKASSIYFHFPGGREEIVAESVRWHYYNFGTAILGAVDACSTAEVFWDTLVREHFRRQVVYLESELWDLLVASDRICGFLQSETRAEIRQWLELFTNLYKAAALTMGHQDCDTVVRVAIEVIDGAKNWCPPLSTERDIEIYADHAVKITRSIILTQLEMGKSSLRTSKIATG